MKLLRKLGELFDRTQGGLAVTGAVILMLLMLSICYAVFTRYFLNSTQKGIFEIWEYSLLYMTMLGTTWVLTKDGHVSVDILITHLKPKVQMVLNIITSLMCAAMFLTLAWYGSIVTWQLFEEGTRLAGELYPPQGAIVIIIPIGSFLLFIQCLRRTYKFFTGWRVSKHEEQML